MEVTMKRQPALFDGVPDASSAPPCGAGGQALRERWIREATASPLEALGVKLALAVLEHAASSVRDDLDEAECAEKTLALARELLALLPHAAPRLKVTT